MKVYANVDVTITYQNFGSVWLVALHGTEDAINLVFNGLFNFNATGGHLSWPEGTKTFANFWSSPAKMWRFFYNRAVLRLDLDGLPMREKRELVNECRMFASQQVELIKTTCQETMIDYTRAQVPYLLAMGTIGAEKPDDDFRDAVVKAAFMSSPKVDEPEEND